MWTRSARRVVCVPPTSFTAFVPASGCLFFFCAQKREYVQLLQHAVLDPDLRSSRQALPIERVAEQLRILGSDNSVTRSSTIFSPILVPPPCFENALRPSSADARVEREREQLHEIADGLRLENHGVAARLDRDRIAREPRLLDRARRATPFTSTCDQSG